MSDIWEEIKQIPIDDFSRLWEEYGGRWEEIEPLTDGTENQDNAESRTAPAPK